MGKRSSHQTALDAAGSSGVAATRPSGQAGSGRSERAQQIGKCAQPRGSDVAIACCEGTTAAETCGSKSHAASGANTRARSPTPHQAHSLANHRAMQRRPRTAGQPEQSATPKQAKPAKEEQQAIASSGQRQSWTQTARLGKRRLGSRKHMTRKWLHQPPPVS